MVSQNETCRCGLKLDRSEAEIVVNLAQLCHHSKSEDLKTAQDAIYKKVLQYSGKFEVREITDRPLTEGLEHYTRITALQDYNALTGEERLIVATGFFRTYEAILQLLRVEALIQIRTGELTETGEAE